MNSHRAVRLQMHWNDSLPRPRGVESELAEIKAGHDPLASHIFFSRLHYRNVNDTKACKRGTAETEQRDNRQRAHQV